MSNAELFDKAYRSVWGALLRRDDSDLSQHERDILSHVPIEGCSLGDLVRHLGLPKSTCSEIVKSLGQRGFLLRVRDQGDERRIRVSLTAKGRQRAQDAWVLEEEGLERALAQMPRRDQATLLRLMGELARLARSDPSARRMSSAPGVARPPRSQPAPRGTRSSRAG